MVNTTKKSNRQGYVLLTVVFAWLAFSLPDAQAVPSMSRMTGMECVACHVVFPELTPFGRQYKLRAYSISTPKPADAPIYDKIPVAGLLQVSQTATKNTGTPGATPDDFVDNRETIVQAVGVYYGCKITDNSGALIQYNWDGVEQKWAVEMVDIRAGDSVTLADKELVWGVTTNNNPTLLDIYTGTPNWAFPHIQSLTLMPAASTMIASGLVSQVEGVGAYGLWDNLVYAEFARYHTANTGFFRPMAAGVTVDNIVSGTAPYWRVAL